MDRSRSGSGGGEQGRRIITRSRLAWQGRARNLGVRLADRGVGPHGKPPAGPRPMQLRYPSGHTGESYVRARAWRDARLSRCPNHPHGGCSFARHGTYARKTPRGTRIARWYCPQSHTTFSLLPDFLAARLPGTLDELEEVVAHAERASSAHLHTRPRNAPKALYKVNLIPAGVARLVASRGSENDERKRKAELVRKGPRT